MIHTMQNYGLNASFVLLWKLYILSLISVAQSVEALRKHSYMYLEVHEYTLQYGSCYREYLKGYSKHAYKNMLRLCIQDR
jgi:hypothetical protein